MKAKADTKTKDFLKEKIDALKTITDTLEDITLPLEYLVSMYEEGMKITQETKQFLSEIEGKIIDIVEQQKKTI